MTNQQTLREIMMMKSFWDIVSFWNNNGLQNRKAIYYDKKSILDIILIWNNNGFQNRKATHDDNIDFGYNIDFE